MNSKLLTARLLFSFAITFVAIPFRPNVNVAAEESSFGLAAPEGFVVTRFADDDLATDIYCMTVDAQGRVVVAGQNYIRILEDVDQDGQADRAKNFAPAPEGGVQGMYFDGNSLYCAGGGGLIRYDDLNADDRADGPPQLMFKIKTGGEHDAHAIRKGPDGKWYLIAGNYAGVTSADINSVNSPVTNVRAGVLMRFDAGFRQRQVFAHGFRNAYDFAFDENGNVFNFDSDGERDVSLPWYRPTRVFQVKPGSDAGFVSRSWKMPNYFFEMPPVIAELGRGSPTGVACYRHQQFPNQYHNSLFVLDWTFGRVIRIKLEHRDGQVVGTPELFLSAKGEFGFAPTDVAIAQDGSMLVSVGGRGTRGSVFRVRWDGSQRAPEPENDLLRCLAAPQPLSSWSRAFWMPLAKKLGQEAFYKAAIDSSLSDQQRIRAVEILTELFNGPRPNQWPTLLEIDNAKVLARVAWMLGTVSSVKTQSTDFANLLVHESPFVKIGLLDAMCGNTQIDAETGSAVLACLHDANRQVRKSAMRFMVIARVVLLREPDQEQATERLYTSEWMALSIARDTADPRAVDAAFGFFDNSDDSQSRLDAVRLMQLGLGDCGPRTGVAPVFEGYSSKKQINLRKAVSPESREKLIAAFPSGDEQVDYELARVCAMASLNDTVVFGQMLEKIHTQSDPVRDIHYLICLAEMPMARRGNQRAQIAQAFVNLQAKVNDAGLKQDNNWEPRISELFAQHQKLDANLPTAVVNASSFGLSEHVMFLKYIPKSQIANAIQKFIEHPTYSEEVEFPGELLRYLADSPAEAHRQLMRAQFSKPGSRDDVILTLARRPQESDREYYFAGLASPEPSVLAASVKALEKFRPSNAAEEQIQLVKALQRVGGDKNDYAVREQIVRLLQKNNRISFGFQFGPAGYQTQSKVVASWVAEIKRRFPDSAKQLESAHGTSRAEVAKMLEEILWQRGNAERGAKIYVERSCAKCHGDRNRLGPDLAGVTRRFSREDLFQAIIAPSETVSSRYRTKQFETLDGKTHTGMVIYESIDGVLLRTANNETIRLKHDDIEFSEYLSRSLMPDNLLMGLTAQQYADLYAYLRQQ